MTPECDTPGCKNPSVHQLPLGVAPAEEVGFGLLKILYHLCPACYERKVWGK